MTKKNILMIVAVCIIMFSFSIGYAIGNKTTGSTEMRREKTDHELIKEGRERIGEE